MLDRTIQVCGALGYSSDLPVEAWYRSTRFGPIGDGPDELHKSVLARTLLKGYTPVEGWPTEHIPSRRPAAEAKWAELRAAAGLRRDGGDAADALGRAYLDGWLGGRVPIRPGADQGWRLVRGVRARPRAMPMGAAKGATPRQLGHRPRRAPGVPHPRRHQGRGRPHRPARAGVQRPRRLRARPSTSWSASPARPSAPLCPPDGPSHPRRTDAALEELIDALVAIHAVDWEACGLGDLARTGDYLPRQLTRWLDSARLATAGGTCPDARRIADWLE